MIEYVQAIDRIENHGRMRYNKTKGEGNFVGWSKRVRYITDFDEIMQYIALQNDFYDCRIGGFSFNMEEKTAKLYVESVSAEKGNVPDTDKIWDFEFTEIKSFDFDMDIAAGFWIYEVCRGDDLNEMVFSADGGSITISAKNISVGIPEN